MNNWDENDLNARCLSTELFRIRQTMLSKIELSRLAQLNPIDRDRMETIRKLEQNYLESSSISSSSTQTIENLSRYFELSPFERDILLLCAGVEFDGTWRILCAEAQGDQNKDYPTLSLALSILNNPHWDALSPEAPLRRWKLIKIKPSNNLVYSPIAIDEQILNHIVKVKHCDERLLDLIKPLKINTYLTPSHQKIAENLVTSWLQNPNTPYPVMQLCGKDAASKKAIASVASKQLNIKLYAVSAKKLLDTQDRLNLIKCLLEREWLLNDIILLLDCDDLDGMENDREFAISDFIGTLNCPLMITTRNRRYLEERPLITFDVDLPTSEEQKSLWQQCLEDIEPNLNGHVDSIVSHFTFSASAIETISWQLKALKEQYKEQNSEVAQQMTQAGRSKLWHLCRIQARPRLDELAQRIDSTVSWEDLVLSDKEREILREIAAHVRQRAKVYESWGMGRKSSRGLGISALFAGASGTGKTLAAEVLGNELNLDVYRIDLSTVVSKYIGETEKNLRKIFDRAEGCGVILLFDEADALFGKRSEVKDSHDRYANMEVSYLLQRIETYRGLTILTTNLKNDLDRAFLRRIRFLVNFPFPDVTMREAIWRRVFPSETPTEDLNFKKLAKLAVAGGNIRNIAMKAAFLAADAGKNVMMEHILMAARSEYAKLEKPLTDGEIKDWVSADSNNKK